MEEAVANKHQTSRNKHQQEALQECQVELASMERLEMLKKELPSTKSTHHQANKKRVCNAFIMNVAKHVAS